MPSPLKSSRVVMNSFRPVIFSGSSIGEAASSTILSIRPSGGSTAACAAAQPPKLAPITETVFVPASCRN